MDFDHQPHNLKLSTLQFNVYFCQFLHKDLAKLQVFFFPDLPIYSFSYARRLALSMFEAGVETCYPQILPHDRGIHCPGACSPYVKYQRPLDRDLFFVARMEWMIEVIGEFHRFSSNHTKLTIVSL